MKLQPLNVNSNFLFTSSRQIFKQIYRNLSKKNLFSLQNYIVKFIYSEKATKFEKIFHLKFGVTESVASNCHYCTTPTAAPRFIWLYRTMLGCQMGYLLKGVTCRVTDKKNWGCKKVFADFKEICVIWIELNPLLISTGFLKYPLKLKKKFSLYWNFFSVLSEIIFQL